MTRTDGEAPIIDTHAHAYTLDMPLSPTSWHKPPADATIEEYVATLDAHGVTFGILAAVSLFDDYNDYQLDASCRYKRLKTTVIVDPKISRDALRSMNDAGAVGIRLQLRNGTKVPDLKSFEYRVLLRRIADLGWHVHIHDDAIRLPGYIAALEGAGPRLVIDHMARPGPGHDLESESYAAVLRAVERGNTWVKLSSGFRLAPDGYAAKTAEKLLAHAGTDRLMWGSDWPFAAFEDRMTYQKAIADYKAWVPDPAIRRAIDRTALAFYFS